MRKFMIFFLFVTNCLIAQMAKWDSIASMNVKRWYPAAIELDNGEILVTGGTDITGYITNTCEIYNSSTNSWRFTDAMNVIRRRHELFLLGDGRVLAVGGADEETSCEIYNPFTEEWTMTDSLLLGRKEGPNAIKLENGNILISGGRRRTGPGTEEIYRSCEIFDTKSEKWTKVAEMNFPRKWHTITSLNNGKILVTGGLGEGFTLDERTKICELYDVSENTWVLGDTIQEAHYDHDALLLNDGKVFISSGQVPEGNYYTEICEIYDPVMNEWNYAGDLSLYQTRHSSFQLNDSLILIDGGDNYNWEIFNLNKQQSTYVVYPDIAWQIPSILKLTNNNIVKIGGTIWHDAAVAATDKCEVLRFSITNIENREVTKVLYSKLYQNYPNPFNPLTHIQFDLPEDAEVMLTVYNIEGKLIKELVNGFKTAGTYTVDFDGSGLASGVYFYKIDAHTQGKLQEYSQVKRMLLIK